MGQCVMHIAPWVGGVAAITGSYCHGFIPNLTVFQFGESGQQAQLPTDTFPLILSRKLLQRTPVMASLIANDCSCLCRLLLLALCHTLCVCREPESAILVYVGLGTTTGDFPAKFEKKTTYRLALPKILIFPECSFHADHHCIICFCLGC